MTGKTARRLWHLGGGSLFPTLALFVPVDTLLIPLSAVTAAFLVMEFVRLVSSPANELFCRCFRGMLKEEERWRPTGSSYLLIASVLAFSLFPKGIAITSLFFLAVGDPAAAAFGSRRALGWQGALACFAGCCLIGMVLIEVGLSITPVLLLGGAAAAALSVLLPLSIDDNLIIPLFSGGIMTLIAACG